MPQFFTRDMKTIDGVKVLERAEEVLDALAEFEFAVLLPGPKDDEAYWIVQKAPWGTSPAFGSASGPIPKKQFSIFFAHDRNGANIQSDNLNDAIVECKLATAKFKLL